MGEHPNGQTPCGTRNIDVTFRTVAVEVCGFASHRPNSSAYRKRCKEIAERGWSVVLVVFTRRECLLGNLDNVVTFLQQADRDPSATRKHWVIRCSSDRFARGKNDRGQFAAVPAPERFRYSIRELHL